MCLQAIDDNISFTEYKKWIDKYIRNNDTREINFQNDVIKRLIEKLFPKYDVVNVGTKGSDTAKHNYYHYSGKYIDNLGREKPTTPDILVANNWNWYNIEHENEIKYIATIEVKSPYGKEAIYKSDCCNCPAQINRHLSAEKIDKVIYTDSFEWRFYTQNKLDNPEKFSFVNRIRIGRGYTYEWKTEAYAQEEFDKLIKKLKDFLVIMKE
ncbi:hypothetical protein DS742_12855 [Lacrimispora amygdalina]|uniref:Restriction endonuclease n=1 Tax=Lacrimispora amygdalina TaxID=253257 RepID=A0A3E2NC20_9FIRM|nr:hypothetical protein [Clostridium indicum]RFZ78558.1 hypothetical protein DS742_12855 [Clostridium indicum]